MKQISGRELAKLAQQRGWVLKRVQGSLYIFGAPGRRERLVIPIHGTQPLKIGLLRSLMKIAALTDADL